MSLRLQAAADLLSIVQDATTGFGWPIVLTSPEGLTVALMGLSTDVGQTIDPETGVAVSGRRASVAIPIATLTALGMGLPRAIADSSSKPWVVRFQDVHGAPQSYKVQEAMPDRALGIVTCLLEAYRTSG
jgi:hypothetical protein